MREAVEDIGLVVCVVLIVFALSYDLWTAMAR